MTDYWIAVLLREGRSRDPQMRIKAEEALRGLSREERERAIEIVDGWMVKRDRRYRIFAALKPLFVLAQMSCFAGLLISHKSGAIALYILILAFQILGLICREPATPSTEELRENLLRPLSAGDEHLDAARLIDWLGGNRYAPEPRAADKLTKALPLLNKDSLNSISRSHRLRLYNFLVIDNLFICPALLFEILGFIDRTRDIEAYAHVVDLSNSPVVTPGAKRFRERARECASTLRPLLENARLGESLLRPSELSESNSSLLRPAGNVQDGAALLLRAAEPTIQYGSDGKCES